jgi:membrane fusion protein (multidrug efflux system)
VAALPDVEFGGAVDFVDPSVQLPGRTITVKAQIPNPRRELKAGMFIEARLATDVRPDAVIVPEDAILPLRGAAFVWVVSDGTASRRQVELGVRMPGYVEIKSGVDVGEHVVVDSRHGDRHRALAKPDTPRKRHARVGRGSSLKREFNDVASYPRLLPLLHRRRAGASHRAGPLFFMSRKHWGAWFRTRRIIAIACQG